MRRFQYLVIGFPVRGVLLYQSLKMMKNKDPPLPKGKSFHQTCHATLVGVTRVLEIRTQTLAHAHRFRVRARSGLASDLHDRRGHRGRGHDARRVCLVMQHLALLLRTRGGGRRQSRGAHQRRGAKTERLCNVCVAGRAKGQGIGPLCWRRAPCHWHLLHASGAESGW